MGHWCLGQVHIGEHRYAAAIPELEMADTLGTTPLIHRDLAWAYASTGNSAKARAILDRLIEKTQFEYLSPYSMAVVHAALGEKDEAFRWLDRAFAERDCHVAYMVVDPEADPLRSDPRFRRLLERLKIPG
jgi:tetratricopeptide (TPR) repeat protein